MTINVALLGFGTVGQGVYQTILSHQKEYQELLGDQLVVKTILVKNASKPRPVKNNVLITTNFEDILDDKKIDIVIEAIVGVEPAFTFVSTLMKQGTPVISANKEMVANKGVKIKELANRLQVEWGYEAAVAGGIPVIRLIESLLHGNRICKIEGILNGTSNFILTQMREAQLSFNDALKLAQENGFAEADPTNDVEGWDTFYKLMILSELGFGEQPSWDDVNRQGISQVTYEAIEEAAALGGRIKLVAKVERLTDGNLKANIVPRAVSSDHPLYSIEGVDNAVNIQTDLLGDLLLKGKGAGAFPSASAVLEDLTIILKKQKHKGYAVSKPISSKVKIVSSSAAR